MCVMDGCIAVIAYVCAYAHMISVCAHVCSLAGVPHCRSALPCQVRHRSANTLFYNLVNEGLQSMNAIDLVYNELFERSALG